MSEIVMSTEAEVEDYTDELSDEALDRAEGASGMSRSGSDLTAGRRVVLWRIS